MPVHVALPDATDPQQAGWTLETALPVVRRAAKAPVTGVVGGPDPFESVQNAVREGSFDEIIVSTLPKRTSKWLRRDLMNLVTLCASCHGRLEAERRLGAS